MNNSADTRIPVTVLTGYLGSGKTTLLNRILTEPHGKKYAVIVNEFGEEGIDGDLIVGADEEIFEMNNGCICCTVRGDLIRIIGGLLKRGRGFDGIIVETTGLADPGPVAQTFFVDEDVKARTRLDGIVTVVDGKHLPQRLKDSPEAAEQIAFADVILLNKMDLISAGEATTLETMLRNINPSAKIIRSERSSAPVNELLDIGAFDLNRILASEPDFLDHGHDHTHDTGISSLSLTLEQPLDAEKYDAFMQNLLAEKGGDLLRYKGILALKGNPRKFAVQGVHMMMEGTNLAPWPDGEARQSRMVFIGRALDKKALRDGFAACVAA